jgi:hypothetical protein
MANRRVFSHGFSVRGRRDRSVRHRSSVLVSAVTVLGTTLSFLIAGSGATAVAVAPVISHAPRVVTGNPHGNFNTWASSNWSGYAETGAFKSIIGSWTVPSVAQSNSATYSSLWIGVDGFNNSNLIQTGTEEDYYNGSAHYNAWWEILPAAETAISTTAYPVSPGDRMSASIYATGGTVSTGNRFFHRAQPAWSITISDTRVNGTSWSFKTVQGYTGPGSSAEWIVEAPQVGGRIATLAHYSFTSAGGVGLTTGDFDNAMVGNTTGSPASTGAKLSYANDSVAMVQNGAQVSTPSDTDQPAETAYNAYYGSALPLDGGAPIG